ncbi:MAG TPA: glycosyltransferase family 2 protein [Smithella sp.]|nr:glycosyltransferase family 2 protein [Smithella sp.]
MLPYFSIVIPMYNRERLIARTINSFLNQDFENYEIIVVDDDSTDKSVDVVKKYTDPRIKLIRHELNRGVGPARNTGVAEAKGDWVICLDSDDEVLPGALSVIAKRSNEVDGNISRMEFMVQMDTGEISPDPPLKNEFWDYIKYMQYMEASDGRLSETFQIIKRAAFEKVRYYDDRTLETPFHLDFMKQFNSWSFPDVLRVYHHDAENQLTRPDINRSIQFAGDQAASWESMLKNHAGALRQHAPRIYKSMISNLATLYFLSGNRLKGVRYSCASLKSNFLSPRYWTILLIGLLGPKPLAWLKFIRSRL